MTESIILANPWLTFWLSAAFLAQVVFRKLHCRGLLFDLIPAAMCVVGLLFALLLGAELRELSMVLCAFFILSLWGKERKEGGEKHEL